MLKLVTYPGVSDDTRKNRNRCSLGIGNNLGLIPRPLPNRERAECMGKGKTTLLLRELRSTLALVPVTRMRQQ